jgi:hypothetical protein
VANLWSQSADGGKPVQITNFSSEFISSEFISNFALSPDGKRIALSRGHSTADVVLIKDFK